ncbi:MAG TPA: M3 family oligoendopeptidase [Gemmatimonadaceae bacterium]|nr:M3 family oligoendopeptidase [Gemmatimonadaceae bacterium]
MPGRPLPDSPAGFATATWADIAPYYDALADEPITRESVEEWLSAWSRLDELVSDAATLATIAYTGNTADPEAEAAHLRFSADIVPHVEEQDVRLAGRLLELGYTRPGLEQMVARFRTDAEIYREANISRFAELEALGASYQKITGTMTVAFDGERKTVAQMQPYLLSPDRATRERAFRAAAQPYIAARDELADGFDQMFALRQQVAATAGFATFQDYIFASYHRFDYTPADCERFHQAVEHAVVPAVERMLRRRRDRLAVDVLRPWDVQVDPYRTSPLHPFRTTEEFVAGGRRIFQRVDACLGEEFGLMADAGLLDLDNRGGKAPGGYCTTLQASGRPFIFMNAVGIPDDVTTLLHESGHCFHSFAAHHFPLVWQRQTGMEAAELASMSMELLASPHLAQPSGYYTPRDARHARLAHLEDVLMALAHIASVDAFQRWIYTSGQGGDRDARDRAWLEIRARFEPAVDWSGLETERVARWYRQLHIFLAPFYYIEYGIAQLGALQVWRNSLHDPAQAVADYRHALSLGGTRPLPEIYAAAGARLIFDPEGMGELVSLLEERMTELRERIEDSAAVA